MADQGDKRKKSLLVQKAINEIAETEAGQIFFCWMAERCHGTRSTIVGNPDSFEINPMGSVCQAYLQRFWFDIRRTIDRKLRYKIEQKENLWLQKSGED